MDPVRNYVSDKVHTLHTLSDTCQYWPVIDQEIIRRRITKSRQVSSHCREKVDKGRGKNNIAELLGLVAKP